MARQENESVARQVQDAFEAMDMARLDALIADDIVWHEIGVAEPRRGKAALRAAAPGGGADYKVTAKLHDIVASDDHAIALVEATATRRGKSLTYRTAEIYHIRDGRIVERWAFSDDTAAITAFFA
ncbi:MAG TPA: nuclear transport factor 2 family protein [Candidatus Baltobacteraceae bacterium]|nr:nuclear transport factor 2 family protein [Candidatus Baltobacteraceae bacterium]